MTALKAFNPIKKRILKTECQVHKFINHQSISILKNDGFYDAWSFFSNYINDLNSGVVWADQDLKNRNHFYNPDKQKGLYGFGDALKECQSYYAAALTWWKRRDKGKSVFYLGASCHLLQDMTVPQHANIKLLKGHRKYERWVVRAYNCCDRFKCDSGGMYLETINDFIDKNARIAIEAYEYSIHKKNLEDKFSSITDIVLSQAQRSTAGFLNMFYRDVLSMTKDEYIKDNK